MFWTFLKRYQVQGGTKIPTLPKICYTYPTMMNLGTVITHLKKIQKKFKHVAQPLSSANISFFTEEKQFLLYHERQAKIAFWYFFSVFYFFWVIIDCFNEHDCDVDDVSQIFYSKPSWNKDILKWKLRCHIFCPWHYQQSFITWLKLSCTCGHVTETWQL